MTFQLLIDINTKKVTRIVTRQNGQSQRKVRTISSMGLYRKKGALQMLQHVDNCLGHDIWRGKRMSKEISKVLKRYVEQSPLDRETIRAAVGVDRSTMSRHLNGKTPLTQQKIQSYANVLGIHVHQLTGVEPLHVIGHTWTAEDHFKVHVYDATQKKKLIYPDVGYSKNLVAICKHKDTLSPWMEGTVYLFDKEDMNKPVSIESLEQWAFVRFEVDGTIRHKLAICYSLAFRPGEERRYQLYHPWLANNEHSKGENSAIVHFVCPIKHLIHRTTSKNWKQVTEGENK